MPTPELIADLKRDEGCRLRAYQDTGGVWTIGYGHTPAQPKDVWTQEDADETLKADVEARWLDLTHRAPWIVSLDQVRQDALANMAFNLGVAGLLRFTGFLSYLRAHRFHLAAQAMLLSHWARQVGDRALRLSHMIEYGNRNYE
jgi:lysozyme